METIYYYIVKLNINLRRGLEGEEIQIGCRKKTKSSLPLLGI